MKFWKLHGIGNDFIAIDQRFNNNDLKYYSDLAKKVCHRRFSVGADGLLIVKKSDKADIKMLYYNSDGSIASMCGNGLRCFVKFVYDNNIVDKNDFYVETLDGIKNIKINLKNNKIETIKVNMGNGKFSCKDIPVISNKPIFIKEILNFDEKKFEVSSMLMGVPHTVIFVDNISLCEIKKYGNLIEKHNIFPEGTNVNFVKIQDKNNIFVDTWERGCGYTLGCGTGMTASAIISNYLGKTDKNVNVTSQGGSVKIDIEEDFVYMTGPSIKICEGLLEV